MVLLEGAAGQHGQGLLDGEADHGALGALAVHVLDRHRVRRVVDKVDGLEGSQLLRLVRGRGAAVGEGISDI